MTCQRNSLSANHFVSETSKKRPIIIVVVVVVVVIVVVIIIDIKTKRLASRKQNSLHDTVGYIVAQPPLKS